MSPQHKLIDEPASEIIVRRKYRGDQTDRAKRAARDNRMTGEIRLFVSQGIVTGVHIEAIVTEQR